MKLILLMAITMANALDVPDHYGVEHEYNGEDDMYYNENEHEILPNGDEEMNGQNYYENNDDDDYKSVTFYNERKFAVPAYDREETKMFKDERENNKVNDHHPDNQHVHEDQDLDEAYNGGSDWENEEDGKSVVEVEYGLEPQNPGSPNGVPDADSSYMFSEGISDQDVLMGENERAVSRSRRLNKLREVKLIIDWLIVEHEKSNNRSM